MRHLARIVFMAVALAWVVPALADTTVFINEIHYDNSGTDTGEAVEVAGPAGTSLSGWKVVLYNGSNGADYATYTLSGTLSDTCSGYGVVSISTPGMQNGSPDGLALIDANGIVRQFLSYEGTFTASTGPAAGVTSVDIGVNEGSATPAGQSLQLAGNGSYASDFTWLAPAASSFGQCNTGETFVASGGGGGGGSGTSLQNGVPITGISGSQGAFSAAYTVDIPSGASNLAISESGGSGDADMYVKYGSEPTLSSYDCRPYIAGNDETCSMTTQAGTYYVKLYGYQSYSNVTLEATWDAPSGGGGGGGSGGGSGYYANGDTSSPTALRNSLHTLLEQVTRIPYTA